MEKRKINPKKVLRLIRQITTAEVIARVGDCKGLAFGDYALLKSELEDKLREHLYGTSNLVELGKKFGVMDKVWCGPAREIPKPKYKQEKKRQARQ